MNHLYIHKNCGKYKPHLYFLDIPYVLEIKDNKWKLYSSEYSYEGATKEEFDLALEDLKVKYDLQTGETKQDKLVIYMEDFCDINQIIDENRITSSIYNISYTIDKMFELYEWTKWVESRTLLKHPILPLMQTVFELFKKVKTICPTPASYGRARLKYSKNKKKSDQLFIQELYPLLDDYFYIHASLYGGLRYCWKTKPCKYNMLYIHH